MTAARRISVEGAVPFGSRLAALDGVRGIAILSVIFYHTLRIEGDGGPQVYFWRFFQESTWCGVDLFFVLSGFLITGILLDSKGTQGYFKNFYARRALRIMPLYYLTLFAALVIVPLLVGLRNLPPLYARLTANQIWLWLYLQNYLQSQGAHQLPGFGHFWTLAVEEQFYWFWPLVVYFTSRRNLFRLCLAICVFEPFVRLVLLQAGVGGWAVRELTFTRVDSLLWGALGAMLFRDKLLLAKLRLPMYAAAGIAALALLAFALPRGFLLYGATEMLTAGYSLFGLLFGVFVLSCAESGGALSRAVSNPVLGFFGRYSYAIYIAHPIIFLAYQAKVAPRIALGRFPDALVCFAAVTASSSALARVSWYLFEGPILRLKKYFEYKSEVTPEKVPMMESTLTTEVAASS